MKSLFTENEEWTEEAREIARKVNALLAPLFKEYSTKVPVREFGWIVRNEASILSYKYIVKKRLGPTQTT